MKSRKEIVFEYILKATQREQINGKLSFDATALADILQMQRTNVSRYLNELEKEKRLIKKKGKPVRFELSPSYGAPEAESTYFKNFIGCAGSMKKAVQLAKASILYPSHSLPTLLVGKTGTGKSFFAWCMAQFAIETGVLKPDAQILKFNCRYYENDSESLEKQLFGDDGMIMKSKGGLLFIDHLESMPAHGRDMLFECLEFGTNGIGDVILICSCDADISSALLNGYTAKFAMRIDLPDLSERTPEERFELTKHYISFEAGQMNKPIRIKAELLRCLLLYKPENNIKQLRDDIRVGCANAYVRQFGKEMEVLDIYTSDFPASVRKGFLRYAEYKQEIDRILPGNYAYTFTSEEMNMTEMNQFGGTDSGETIYDIVDRKIVELKQAQMSEEEINTVISADLQSGYAMIRLQMNEKLGSELPIDERIVSIVRELLKEASEKTGSVYFESVFYGLCYHCDAVVHRTGTQSVLSDEDFNRIVLRHPLLMELSRSFVRKLEGIFSIQLADKEAALITMFLIPDEEIHGPSVLVALHGNSAASSIVETVRQMMGTDNIQAYDLPLSKPMQEAYEELKKVLQETDRGSGVLVFYDMGSLRTMFETAGSETGIPMRLIQLPLTLTVMDSVRKAMMTENLDDLYKNVSSGMRYTANDEDVSAKGRKKAVITLCMSGMGGARRMKEYIEKNCDLIDTDVIALAQNDTRQLRRNIANIMKDKEILCVVGTYDPKLYSLKFVSVSQLFETPADRLSLLLSLENDVKPERVDLRAVFSYLSEQMPDLRMHMIKRVVPPAVSMIRKAAGGLTVDQETGLLVHLVCCIHRLKHGEITPENKKRDAILNRHKRLYSSLCEILQPLEEEFEVSFTDDELANIINIVCHH